MICFVFRLVLTDRKGLRSCVRIPHRMDIWSKNKTLPQNKNVFEQYPELSSWNIG